MDKTLEQCYETLGLSIDATKEEVRKAYKKLALKCHPDKNQNSPEANRKFQELGFAYKRITEDEDLEEIDEDCSDFDYWTEVFFYCLLKEHFQVHRNREHCCPNCAQYTDEDEEFFEDLYKKHKSKQKEMTFTDEEMKHFVKFKSLKEQREFNKKTFCDSKKSSKPKNEPKVQKVKMKTNKQLKAEQWKREKEMSKIAEEIEIKNKQEEQKKYIKECEEMKKEKEKSAKNGIEIKEQVNGNKLQCGTRHKEQLSKENNKTGNNMPTKQKPKKKHKKVKAKAEDNNTQKFGQQEHKTCKSTTPVVTKPATTSSVMKRIAKPSKPVAPVFRPSKLVQQPAAKCPTPITLPQPPNIWMKRLETHNEIQEIQPTNEEEELRQLEIALEMSKKQVEIEQQQKQIAALQEEIRLMSLEQENLIVQDTSEDTPEAVAFLPSCDMLTDVGNCNERLGNNNDLNSNEVSTDSQAAMTDEHDKEQLNGSPDAGAVDDSSENECDCTCTHEIDTGSTLGEKYASVFHEPQQQFFRPRKNSKVQTQACASREKNNAKEMKPCPYGRNCCLGKKCKYSHLVAKGEGGLNHNQSLCSEAKQHESHVIVDAEIIDEVEHDRRSASGCGIMENNLLVTEDWDDEIENIQVISSASHGIPSHLLQGSASSSSMTENEPRQIVQNSYSAEPNDCGKDSNSWVEKEYEKEPVICSEFDVTNEICATEDWEHEIEDDGLDLSITGKSFSQTKYPSLMTERPYEELQGFKAITSNVSTPMASNTSYTIQPSLHILSGETLSCHGEDKSTLLNGETRECMSSTCHEETDRNWEEQSHATSIGSMNNVHNQETYREWQDEWDESLVNDAVRMNNQIHCNDDVDKQSRNIPQQAVVDDARIKPIPCHQSTVPGIYPVITDSVQFSQKQFQTNPCTKLTQGPQYCLPFPSAGMPGVYMGGTVMHQPGLYNIPQMPSLFMPNLNYPYVQSGGSGVNPQASLLPMPAPGGAPGYHPGGSNQLESTSVCATSESGTLKSTRNSSISSTKQVPNLNTPNFPVLPNMCFGFQGNTPNVCAGVPSNMNGVPNIQQGPLMAVPFPVIPGFLPAISQQPLLSNNLLNMSSTVGKESNNNNNLQELNKLASGPVSDYNVNYQSSWPLNPLKGSANGHPVNGPNPIQYNPLIDLESNYYSILEMQMNGSTTQIDMSCARENQTSTMNVSQEYRRIETSPSATEEKKISESEYMKRSEDMLKMNDIRKPSSVPKALSYAERHQ